DLVADSVLDGLTEGQAAMGVDIGAQVTPVEPALRMASAKAAAGAEPVKLEPADEAMAAEAEVEPAAAVEAEPTEAAAEEPAPAEAPGGEERAAAEAAEGSEG